MMKTIYLNDEDGSVTCIGTRQTSANFQGSDTLDIGSAFNANRTYLNGSLKGVSITDSAFKNITDESGKVISSIEDQITAQMNTSWNSSYTTTRVEDFSMGKNTDEWCGGCGATFGNAVNDYSSKSCLMTYYSPQDGTTSNIYKDGNSDNKTGAIWGPQFTVADSLPDDAKISFKVAGHSTKLNENSHYNGGTGVALWDIDAGDFIRDSSGDILSYTGNSSGTWFDASFSLKGLEGHNLMLVAMDRQINSFGWIALTDVTADTTQISAISSAAQHSLVLNSYNFDTQGSFDGMYEIDSSGNKLESVTHFTNGSRQGSVVTNFYVDQSGSFSAGKKGFLSSGTAQYGEETTTGILRSDNFLVQGDVLEFYISGGNNIDNKYISLVDAETGTVYFKSTGDKDALGNHFLYDMWNLKDIQGKSVYIKIVDMDANTSGEGWAHLEIDQIQQTKFAPTAAMVSASTNKSTNSQTIEFNTSLPGINAKSYSLTDSKATTLDELATYIANGGQSTGAYYRYALGDWGGFTAGAGQGVEVKSTVDVTSSGQYTFALVNDEACRLMLNGSTIFETEGSDVMQFIPFTLTQTGQYALDMLYLDNSGKGVALYVAEGAFDSWNDSFHLLSGWGNHLNSYGSYFVGSNFVPEPSTWALLILGFAGLMWLKKKK